MPKLICLDTSTAICSVCSGDSTGVIHLSEIDRKNSHTETITLQIRECVEKAGWSYKDIDGVAVSAGPGSYTGLRVGTSAAKGLVFALDIPLISVPTLMALAKGISHECNPDELIMPMIDARRMEVYTAIYDHDLNIIEDTTALILEKGIFDKFSVDRKIIVCGNGCSKVNDINPPMNVEVRSTNCSSAHMLAIAIKYYSKEKFVDVASYVPAYLKSPNVTKSKKKFF
jgi:tRNA threonylcarbamoyladenosine biosynthesis protein TsaB